MKKIGIVTATRAEYGLLTPLIRRVEDDKDLQLDLMVTGAHLSKRQGYTIKPIQKDGFLIAHKIPILEEGNTPYDISVTMANAVKRFASCFRDDRPDMVVILGDRTEMLGIACAAVNERIPIAHIHGGEITEGAVDDCMRHALTKMSYLHFTTTEVYRSRVIQLGEEPDRVFNVGALGTENILHETFMDENELRHSIGIPNEGLYAVVTFHPVTLENKTAEQQASELCGAMDERPEYFYLITKANTDCGGDVINARFEEYARNRTNVIIVDSLGTKRYLNAVNYAAFVLGNSSSGIFEAPVLGTPVVNIGDRQKGRIMPETVICCMPEKRMILESIDLAVQRKRIRTNMFGDGTTSERIVGIIKEYLMNDKINLKKTFYKMQLCASAPVIVDMQKHSS